MFGLDQFSMGPLSQGLLMAGLSMMQSSQPSTHPTSLADTLLTGLGTGITSYAAAGGFDSSQQQPAGAIPDPTIQDAYSVPLGDPGIGPQIQSIPSPTDMGMNTGGGLYGPVYDSAPMRLHSPLVMDGSLGIMPLMSRM